MFGVFRLTLTVLAAAVLYVPMDLMALTGIRMGSALPQKLMAIHTLVQFVVALE